MCWFGGIKLGVGGLVCVYGGVVVECLCIVFCLFLVVMVWLQLLVGFEDLGILYVILFVFGVGKFDEQFDVNGVCLWVELLVDQVDVLKICLCDVICDCICI